ncbi:MAG TPA: PHP domain-containing protein [Steroidobacteraceae bacterium]|jgi:hypothetical protein|nr:PHP domain-containing protein [Steroidobacteraceae bacterium]
MNIDLHTHSSCSDGSLSPSALIERAARAAVDVLALTDHDTVAGLEEARAAASLHGISLVPGTEISAQWRSQTLHVLGLGIDPASPELCAALDTQAERRRERLRRMCARLDKQGLPGARFLAELEHESVPTRSHLARAMVRAGVVSRPDQAMRKYLGAGQRAHVSCEWPALAEVVAWIRAAGGAAVLAHPARYRLSAGARRLMLAHFTAAGGAALEVVTGPNGAQHAPSLAAMAVGLGLAGSVGSDFHHPEAAWNPLGRSLKLPDGVPPVWHTHKLL